MKTKETKYFAKSTRKNAAKGHITRQKEDMFFASCGNGLLDNKTFYKYEDALRFLQVRGYRVEVKED